MPRVNQLGFSGYAQTPLEELGYSSVHRRDGADLEAEITDIQQVFPDLVFTGDKIEEINVSKLRAGSLRVDEYLQSTGFVTGVSGWQITGDGDAEFNSGTFRGSLVAGSIHIPDIDTTANSFHVNTLGKAWWGCTQTSFNADPRNAKAYVLSTGAAFFQSIEIADTADTETLGNLTFDTTNGLITSGRITAQKTFTAGHLIHAGSAVAVESDGLIYRTRATAFSTINSNNDSGVVPAPSISQTVQLLNVSSVCKLYCIEHGSGGFTQIDTKRVGTSPSSSTLSITSDSIAGGASGVTQPHMAKITDTMVLQVYNNSGAIKMRSFSGLSSTMTVSAIVAVATGTNPYVERVSDTEALVIYTDASNDIKAYQVTFSGATPSLGTLNTVASHASDVYESRMVKVFGTTSTYTFYYRDTTNSIAYVIAGTYSGGTLTMGSALNANVVSGGTYTNNGWFHPYDDTTLAFIRASTGNNIYASHLTVSGTTLTLSNETSLVGIGGSTRITVGPLGKYTFCLGYRTSSTDARLKLVEMDTSSFTAVGSTLDVSVSAGESLCPAAVYHSPTRLVMARDNGDSEDMTFNVVDLTTNYAGTLGVTPSAIASAAVGLVVLAGEMSSGVSGLTTASPYYANLDGAFVTAALGGSTKLGVATGAASFVTQV